MTFDEFGTQPGVKSAPPSQGQSFSSFGSTSTPLTPDQGVIANLNSRLAGGTDTLHPALKSAFAQQHPILSAIGGGVTKAMDVGSSLFKHTGELVGGAAGMAGEGAAAAIDKNVRDQMMNSSPEEFKRMFPFLGKFVDVSAAKAAEQIGGESLGTAAELGSFATPGAGALPSTAVSRIAAGTTIGAASGAASAMTKGGSAADVGKSMLAGEAIGAATSGTLELLRKAGEVLPKDLYDSSMNPYKKDMGKVERLVDDKTLGERLNDAKLVGTNKQIVEKLGGNIERDSASLKGLLSGVDGEVGGDKLTGNLPKLLYNEKAPLSQEAQGDMSNAIQKYEDLYKDKTFSAVDLLNEKRGLGADLTAKGFTTDPVALRQMNAEKTVQRALYDNAKTTIEQMSGNAPEVVRLNNDLSTWLDAKSIFSHAKPNGSIVGKLLPLLAGGGAAMTEAAVAGSAINPGVAIVGGAAYGITKVAQTTLAKTVAARVLDWTGQKISSEVASRITNELIAQIVPHLTGGSTKTTQ